MSAAHAVPPQVTPEGFDVLRLDLKVDWKVLEKVA
jgi:hypothetical protein